MTLSEHMNALTAAEAADNMIAANLYILSALIDGGAFIEADFQAKVRLAN